MGRQHPSTALPRLAFRPREVAESLGMSYDRVLELIHEGRLRAKKEGQHYVIPRAAIEDYLAAS